MKEEQRVQCEICKVWKSNKKVLENHKRAEVSPIKCDVRECVVRT